MTGNTGNINSQLVLDIKCTNAVVRPKTDRSAHPTKCKEGRVSASQMELVPFAEIERTQHE